MEENKRFIRKQSVGNYTDNQTRSLIIAIQPIVFSSRLLLAQRLCRLRNLFLGDKLTENHHVIDIANTS